MELDELKDLLSRAAETNTGGAQEFSLKTGHAYDPFRQIKKRCGWIFLFFAGTSIIFIPFFWVGKNLLFAILYLILAVESFVSLAGYWQIRSIEQAGGNIKQNLVIRIRRLHFIFHCYVYLNVFFYILLAFALEYLIRDHFISGIGFENIVFPIRLVLYLTFIIFQYLQKQRSFQKNYGSYLSSMIHLLNQTHED